MNRDNEIKNEGSSRKEETRSFLQANPVKDQQQNRTDTRINTFSDQYDTWTHEQLVTEARRRGLL
jgi:hypothetical protein